MGLRKIKGEVSQVGELLDVLSDFLGLFDA